MGTINHCNFFVLLLHNSDISREGKICSNAYFSSRYIISNMNKIPCIQMISLFDSSQFTFKLWAKKRKNNLIVWVVANQANRYILKFCFHLFCVLHSKANNWVSFYSVSILYLVSGFFDCYYSSMSKDSTSQNPLYDE